MELFLFGFFTAYTAEGGVLLAFTSISALEWLETW